jgi:hypothetical protein
MESLSQFFAGLLPMERWLEANKTEAAQWLPRLLALSGPNLSQELAADRVSGRRIRAFIFVRKTKL